MIHHLAESIELSFWNIAIPLMTHSNVVRNGIRAVYKIQHDRALRKDLLLSCAISLLGFAAGLIALSLTGSLV
ncbi:MAG TPA: hypothetical protein PLV27_03130 [Anaerolineaceae bacterium]|nr:hypothetical protein [Anaerolineaceae bacterium]